MPVGRVRLHGIRFSYAETRLGHSGHPKAERVSGRFVSPILRAAYLSPDMLERTLLWREPPPVTLLQMIEAIYLSSVAGADGEGVCGRNSLEYSAYRLKLIAFAQEIGRAGRLLAAHLTLGRP